MSFLTAGAFTSFTANTKAKSAEVNSNFSAVYSFLNTTTSDALIGTLWQKVVSTTGSMTISTTDTVRTALINVNTSAGYTVTLPAAASNTHRMLTLKNTGVTTGAMTVDANGAETIDGTLTVALNSRDGMEIHCDGSNWHRTSRALPGAYFDYRTFTPVLDATVNSPSITYTSQVGLYSRVAAFVFFQVHIEFTNISTAGSGNLVLSGFPVAFAANRILFNLITSNLYVGSAGNDYNYCADTDAAGNATLALKYYKDQVAMAALGTNAINTTGIARVISFNGVYHHI